MSLFERLHRVFDRGLREVQLVRGLRELPVRASTAKAEVACLSSVEP